MVANEVPASMIWSKTMARSTSSLGSSSWPLSGKRWRRRDQIDFATWSCFLVSVMQGLRADT